METILKILLGIALVLLIIYLGLTILGRKINPDFITWIKGDCPDWAKELDSYPIFMGRNNCEKFKAQINIPLIVPSDYEPNPF